MYGEYVEYNPAVTVQYILNALIKKAPQMLQAELGLKHECVYHGLFATKFLRTPNER